MTDVALDNSSPTAPPALPASGASRFAKSPRLDKRRLIAVAAAVLVAAGAALLYAFNPSDVTFFPPCPLHKLTGLHCPGCGTTRALHHLLHGRVAAAFDLNPLLIASLPLILYAVARDVARFVRPRPGPPRILRPWVVWTIAAAVIAYGVARNLPYPGLAWLAP